MSKQRTAGQLLTAPVLALTALGFVLGGCEYVSVVILPDIAADLGVSLSAAGRLVSVFAAGYAIGTPVTMAATARLPRFRLLMALMALFLAVNTLSMLAPNIAVLYIARALAAVLTGTLTAVALLFVRQVAPPEHTAQAVAMVYTGMSLATVVGNPLNKTICRLLGWRATFTVILLVGAVLLPILARVLPRAVDAPAEGTGFFRQFTVLRDRRYALCVVMTICYYAATYVVYTYLTPILTDVLGAGEAAVSLLLMLVGLCCMGSNLLAGWLGERGGVTRTLGVILAQTALFAAMPLLLGGFWPGLAAVFLMALLMYVLSTPVQVFAMTLAEREYPFASSLCASTLSVAGNIGIAAGSFASSGLQAAVGLRLLGLPAAAVSLAAAALNLALLRACGRPKK
ncbi:MFS transporter [Dysosmobacter sp.]|uniref:MFS transporter n=1 Tax=Dysosmobacter sp. TaxID=2591382 RepID=UPI002A8E0B28|nr:MFS transporter [Dysosmobacter sp.]MDY3984304.1 MFS transporter [Dysosmobacter sp.]